MTRSMFVTSNCQTGGLAAAFQALFPNYIVTAMEQPVDAASAAIERLLRGLSPADIWIRNGGHQKLTQTPEVMAVLKGKTTIDLPHANFRAFHPDCVGIWHGGKLAAPYESSQIIAWGYRNRLSQARVRRLFRAEVYRELGYFALWDPNVERLRRSFASCGLDFLRFLQRLKRTGAFMHTPGHPKIDYLITLSQVVAIKLGQDPAIMHAELILPDALAQGIRWPVYPEIGDELGVPSSALWKVHHPKIGIAYLDLSSFIEFSYESYAEQGIAPAELIPGLQPSETAVTERVLSSWSQRL